MVQPVALIGAPSTFSASTSSGSTLQTLPVALRSNGDIVEQLVVTNLGDVDVFLAFTSDASGSVTATGSSRGYPILARTKETLTVGAATKVALITASGSADVSFQRARGI